MATSWSESIVQYSTKLKTLHITELQTAINNERVRRHLTTSTFTSLTALSNDENITEPRTAIKAINNTAFTDDPAAVGTINKTVNITELRTRVNLLESYNDGANVPHGCSASCTGFCTSCTGCTGCTGSCTGSCTSTCTGSCTAGCKGTCSVTCEGTCQWGCDAECATSCSLSCQNCCDGCGDNCASSVANIADNECNMSCVSTCRGGARCTAH